MRKILIFIGLYIPILNVYLFSKWTKNTLANWTTHKNLLWVTNIQKIKIIYCTGNGFITIYEDDDFNILTTCCDNSSYEEYKHIWNAEIKYLKGDENGVFVIQLWNTKKLNKIYGVENRNAIYK